MEYNNYQLYRTLTKLSGNMQLDLVVERGKKYVDDEGNVIKDETGNLYVRDAHLTPVSPYSKFVPVVDEYILNNSHLFNIKEFYKKTKSEFFNPPIDSSLESDWPIMVSNADLYNLKYIKTWDDSFWAGTRRMSAKLYGTTHCTLVPLWLEHVDGPITIGLNVGGSKYELCLSMSPTNNELHDKFCQYLFEYFDNIGLLGGNNNVLNLEFESNTSYIYGIQVNSGIVTTEQIFNLNKQLLTRMRLLLETNSLITNQFPDNRMICSQLLNLNICFDCSEFIGDSKTCEVSVDIRIGAQSLEKYDFYTNHEYIKKATIRNSVKEDRVQGSKVPPKISDRTPSLLNPWAPSTGRQNRPDYYQTSGLQLINYLLESEENEENQQESEENDGLADRIDTDPAVLTDNVLDFKQDYRATELQHANKIVQSICHWQYVDYEGLFNLYNGFGPVNIDIKEDWKIRSATINHLSVPYTLKIEKTETGENEVVGKRQMFYFDKTVVPTQDNTASLLSKEIVYRKYDHANEYLLRRGGKLRPALFPNRLHSKPENEEDEYISKWNKIKYWETGYGRNYLYIKDVQMPIYSGFVNNNFNNYVKLGIPPTYPSIGYESIYKVNGAYSRMGDLLYDFVHPRYLGLITKLRSGYFNTCSCKENDINIRYGSYDLKDINKVLSELYQTGTDKQRRFLSQFQEGRSGYISDWRYPEYKWFDKSQIASYPKEYELWAHISDNDFDKLKDLCLSKMYKQLSPEYDDNGVLVSGIEGIDKVYLWSIYDFKFDLQYATNNYANSQGKFIYAYKVKAFLK